MFLKNKKGFTLIELLVVIAIISLLSSIVMASLKSARLKAKDAAIKQEVRQLANLMALEYNDNNSYLNLQPAKDQWIDNEAECNTVHNPPAAYGFSGTYATNAKQICVNMVTLTGRSDNNTNMHLGNNVGTGNALDNNKFSIMAYLPHKSTYFCMGSSGRSSDIESNGIDDDGNSNTMLTFDAPGCYANP